ncbi:MAG TPA: hypothetical protein ENN95_01955 [Deltaproteobacteria bacterium]|nr:hypothetical protein [Deltaproteobacteria bacterium]
MSEKQKNENARRKGREAARRGQPMESNPMSATSSRYYWQLAYLEEMEKQKNILERSDYARTKF